MQVWEKREKGEKNMCEEYTYTEWIKITSKFTKVTQSSQFTIV
jgi:hypothetical protein